MSDEYWKSVLDEMTPGVAGASETESIQRFKFAGVELCAKVGDA